MQALIHIGSVDCLPVLEDAARSADLNLARKARSGILQIYCRAVLRIWAPHRLRYSLQLRVR